jgi:hypothetical protein
MADPEMCRDAAAVLTVVVTAVGAQPPPAGHRRPVSSSDSRRTPVTARLPARWRGTGQGEW